MMQDKYEILNRYFGYTSFRGGQEALIDAQLSGRDALGIMPTGGGKSLCYQIPALMLPGITLVVSPLISLMKDQVMALKNAGIQAAYINSSLTPEQQRKVRSNLWAGMYKIVYVAPERLLGEGFVALAQKLNISLVAVDEAHCISQWGQDFRPSYLKIVEFLDKLPRRPVIAAFTATATAQVRQDIERILGLREPVRVVTGFDRPNLKYQVLRPWDKSSALSKLLSPRRQEAGIVYCATRKDVEKVCQELQEQGFSATRYHAGLSDQERQQNQDDFIYDRASIMVATNAFGMGIDKSNVSFVIHYAMPKSLEAYYQEAGRAGRDGQPADCVLLFTPGDIHTALFLIQNSAENQELDPQERDRILKQDYARLKAMEGYCKTSKCLRGYILDYFGQSHPPHCGNCGTCLANTVEEDVTTHAQMILSCIRRIRDRLGYSVGATLLLGVLRGSRAQRLTELGLHRLTTYGLLKDQPAQRVRLILEYLEAEGYVHTDSVHRSMDLTQKAGEILFHGRKVLVRLPKEPQQVPKENASPEVSQSLLTALKELRSKLAKSQGVPAYIVFSDATLTDMAAKCPSNLAEFMGVSGVGESKARRYAKPFLERIQTFKERPDL